MLALLGLLAACGGLRESRLNPLNWFGGDREEKIVTVETVVVADPRPLVAEIVSLRADRVPGGAIINVVGLPASQGFWHPVLVPLKDEKPDKGVLAYEFRLLPPPGATPTGNKRSREVVVGHFVSTQTLNGVNRIQVRGAKNRRTVRR